MCQLCLDALKQYWPHLSEKEWSTLLWGATAYPAAEGEHVAKQLKDKAEQSGGDLDRALAIAETELEEAMRNRDNA